MRLLCLLPLSISMALSRTIASARQGDYSLNLTLAGPVSSQYWGLEEANFPLISRTSLAPAPAPSIFHIQFIDTRGDTRKRAPKLGCMALVNALAVDSSAIQRSPRHIQYKKCYVSWHTHMSGKVVSLFSYVRSIYTTCHGDAGVSGTYRTKEGLRICLSNRRKYC
ncbi:hypothetical protein CC86DRAFT_330648 [Ophiobolus disseminans]|uniref:WD-like domain-containing protein n=1 Tax=Ophiobolus disseminans TaxID=1469910 RepID=A0A6A6ZMU4_9PLEO|nr:hypothetical protein CC86DRAFT_330648 [Ophiobolus disseminans]